MGGDPGIWAMALRLPFARYRQILMGVADAVNPRRGWCWQILFFHPRSARLCKGIVAGADVAILDLQEPLALKDEPRGLLGRPRRVGGRLFTQFHND